MKKLVMVLLLILVCTMLSGCVFNNNDKNTQTMSSVVSGK